MKKINLETFLNNFYKRYPTGLDLDLSKFKYISARSLSTTTCKIHNLEILNSANNLMQGIKRCSQCKSDSISDAQSYNLSIFLKKSKEVHGERYDYSLVNWKNTKSNVTIICKIHGKFDQNPQSHWGGYGCPKCGYVNLKKSLDQLLSECMNVHGDRYDYSLVDYKNNYSPITVMCKNHGPFLIEPKNHILNQRGCPSCFKGNRSWKEIHWLTSLSVPEDCRQKKIKIGKKSFLVDGKVGNTVYEFWGDYWHGNPEKFNHSDKNTKCGKTFGELYNLTMEKRKIITDAGFDLVEIWESDYNKIINEIKKGD